MADQHLQGVIVSRMVLGILDGLNGIYRRKNNPGKDFNFLLVAMAVYERADTDAPEMTISDIAAKTRLARKNVERIVVNLTEFGVIRKIAGGRAARFVSNPDFANDPAWHEATERVRDLILVAADFLRALWA